VAGALFDAAENVALLRMLQGSVSEPWPRVAFRCAVPKFFVIVGGIDYAAGGARAARGEG